MHKQFPVVLVTSPPLREQAEALLREYVPEGSVLVWRQGDGEACAAIRTAILSGAWALCISFYNDYIFSSDEIHALGCIVNIHPALPMLRGRGYDILPLLENHREHGVTLHFVSEAIDAGHIIDVIKQPIPRDIQYPAFRVRNQELSLAMLERFLKRCRHADIAQLSRELRLADAASGFSWSGPLVTSAKLGGMLREWRRNEPDHPQLRHVPRALESGHADGSPQAIGTDGPRATARGDATG
ncbi:MAG: hypothetical protein WCR51_11990 [Planctomycetia bacterium]